MPLETQACHLRQRPARQPEGEHSPLLKLRCASRSASRSFAPARRVFRGRRHDCAQERPPHHRRQRHRRRRARKLRNLRRPLLAPQIHHRPRRKRPVRLLVSLFTPIKTTRRPSQHQKSLPSAAMTISSASPFTTTPSISPTSRASKPTPAPTHRPPSKKFPPRTTPPRNSCYPKARSTAPLTTTARP